MGVLFSIAFHDTQHARGPDARKRRELTKRRDALLRQHTKGPITKSRAAAGMLKIARDRHDGARSRTAGWAFSSEHDE